MLATEASRGRRPAGLAHHLAAGVAFMIVSVWLTYPLISQLDTHIPGNGAGDNVSFLWNAWWFEQWATGRASDLFHTDRLFAPFGTPLVLHTHAFMSAAVASLFPLQSLVARYNAVILVGLAANGLAAYALAFWHTRHATSSFAAGLIFSTSAYVCVHLLGHFNLVHAWVLPLAILCLLRCHQKPTASRAVVVGVACALIVYTDYYYFVYFALIVLISLVVPHVVVRGRYQPPRLNGTLAVLLGLCGLLIALICALLVYGDLSFAVAGRNVSVRHVRNPLTVLYATALCTAVYAFKVRLSVTRRRPAFAIMSVASAGIASATVLLLTLPVGIPALQLVSEGAYVSQPIHWRSSPPGVDFLTVITGHPAHVVTGHWTRGILDRLSIDIIEQSAWLGLAVVVLMFYARRTSVSHGTTPFWVAVAVVFLILAAGPFMRIAGIDTGIPLPWAFLRYVPLISNARIPGRAVIVVVLALAVLSAVRLSSLTARARLIVMLLLAMEALPRPVPLYRLPQHDLVDEHLRLDPAKGAVAELPTGARDGFGGPGQFDHRALVHQIHHGRPIVGGFVARLSPHIARSYAEDPLISKLVAISAGSNFSDGVSPLGDSRVPFVVVNVDALPDVGAIRNAISRAGYKQVVSAGPRELYRLHNP